MAIKHVLFVIAASACALSAFAQSSAPPSNAASSPERPADNTAADGVRAVDRAANPGALPQAAGAVAAANPYAVASAFHYDDPNPRNHDAASRACDDATYGEARVHGSIAAGVVAGSRVSGNYQGGVVSVSKALGSCDAPAGEVNVSVSVSKEDFNRSRRRHH
jgi:hypothetical protein